MGNFSICKNAKLSNISFISQVKLCKKHFDKRKIQHSGNLLGMGKTGWAGVPGNSAILGLVYFVSRDVGTHVYYMILYASYVYYVFSSECKIWTP